MTGSKGIIFKKSEMYWIQRICILLFTTFLFTACASPQHETGEEPIPPGIENQIHPNVTTQDDVLGLLGEPVARLKTAAKEDHVHIWTYSYMYLHGSQKGRGESLTITFDNKTFLVLSVVRGPL